MPPEPPTNKERDPESEPSEVTKKKKCQKNKKNKHQNVRKLKPKRPLFSKKNSTSVYDDEEDNRKSVKGSSFSINRQRGSVFESQVQQLLRQRDNFRAYETRNEVVHDVTPKLINISYLEDKFKELQFRTANHEIMKGAQRRSSNSTVRMSTSRVGGLRVSMEDVMQGMDSSMWEVEQSGLLSTMDSSKVITEKRRRCKVTPFLKVTLEKSEEFLLYMQQSSIVLRETAEGQMVEADNKTYEYLTVGKGKIRRRSEAEAQTMPTLVKSREVNTDPIPVDSKASYVSSYEIYDTEKALAAAKERRKLPKKQLPIIEMDEPSEDHNTSTVSRTHRGTSLSEEAISAMDTPEFRNVYMIMKRICAANTYEEDQCRFRDMIAQNPLSEVFRIKYELHLLFRFHQQSMDKQRKSVTDMCFCPGNGDILAVSYGIYSFSSMHVPDTGYVCVWNIKNPDDPERCYYYEKPVSALAFSPYLPSLLAVGLYNGNLLVHDISEAHTPPVAVSHRSTSASSEPIVAIRWIKLDSDGSDGNAVDPFLALSEDGTVTRFRVIKSAHLLGYRQMVLERVEGRPDGIKMSHSNDLQQQANRHPQGLALTLHPVMHDIYYIFTDEGCMHKCSINYPHQHLEVGQMHEASVNCMDFSPWSPKLFLTCGNDWCMRVWLDGIYRPLLTLRYESGPIHCAFWSRRISSIIIAINRKTIDIWDIRRSTLAPVTSVTLDTSYYTMGTSNRSGTVIAVGNERGNVLMCALENFPLPPHYQFDELERAIYKAIENDQDLTDEVKLAGLVGYPNQAKVL